MRNTWLVIRREYLERVRAKSFLISTLLIPAFIYGVTVLPTQLATRKGSSTRRIAVVTSDPRVSEAITNKLQSTTSGNKYEVQTKVGGDTSQRDALKKDIESGSLDGYLWLASDAIASGKVEYVSSSTSDFVEIS